MKVVGTLQRESDSKDAFEDLTGSGGSPGAAVLSTAEVALGTTPRRSGRFTIPGTGLTVGKPLLIVQAVGPYTGKGTLADEAEMDQITVAASVTSATEITAYWVSAYLVAGNFKFNYMIGA